MVSWLGSTDLSRKSCDRWMESVMTYCCTYKVKVRYTLLELAYSLLMGGYLGVNKTENRIQQHFRWPKWRRSEAEFENTCHVCQMVDKPNQNIKSAPLKPVPAFDIPFSRAIIDCIGPMPKAKSGNCYLLTIMCASIRFLEAIPLRKYHPRSLSIHAIWHAQRHSIWSRFQFHIWDFSNVMHQLGIKHVIASAYHPQSQGALKQYHQKLKAMTKAYYFDNRKYWDEWIHMFLFC